MTDYQNEIVTQALNEYAGWFDDHFANDRPVLDAIYQALNSKNPLEHDVTEEALKNYYDALYEVACDDFYPKDQRDNAINDLGVVDDLLTH